MAPTFEPSEHFELAIERIDRANAEDPNIEMNEGAEQPKELLYSRRMTAALDRLRPDAPETVRLAVRAQHIQRWKIPRADYPKDRQGYRRWRTDLGRFHAETAGGILREVGYDAAFVERVGALLRKERLKVDPECQLLEDVICLVFLEHYLGDFAGQHEEEKLLDIVRKTWRKMSERGREAALGLELPEHLRELVGKALAK